MDDKYTYHGTRTKTSNSYVLIFDPHRQVYVLHKVDSSFDANLTQAPWEQDAARLRETYPQLGGAHSPRQKPAQGSQRVVGRSPRPQYDPTIGKRRKVERKKEAPRKAKAEPIRKAVEPEDIPMGREEEEEEDDGTLTIEYPGASDSTRGKASTPLVQLSYSEAESEEESDGEDIGDADGNRDVEVLELPSPVGSVHEAGADEEEEEVEEEVEEEEEEDDGADEHVAEDGNADEELDPLDAAFHEALTQTEAEQDEALAKETEAALVGSARADESSESEEE